MIQGHFAACNSQSKALRCSARFSSNVNNSTQRPGQSWDEKNHYPGAWSTLVACHDMYSGEHCHRFMSTKRSEFYSRYNTSRETRTK